MASPRVLLLALGALAACNGDKTGPTATDGADAADGTDGTDGTDGADGTDGTDGTDTEDLVGAHDGVYSATMGREGGHFGIGSVTVTRNRLTADIRSNADLVVTVNGRVQPSGEITITGVTANDGTEIEIPEARITRGIIEATYVIAETEGQLVGSLDGALLDQTPVRDFDGSYAVSLVRDDEEVASMVLDVKRGAFATNVTTDEGLAFDLGGFVTSDGLIVISEVTGGAVIAEASIDQDSFDIEGIYRAGDRVGRIFGPKERLMRLLPLLLSLLALLCATPAFALDVEDFDVDYGEWEFSPQKIGRSTTDGWAIVTNAGDKAARNTKTGTKYTYYWKLSRDFDLTDAVDPKLDVKMHFKGHNYDYAAIQVGPKGASRLSDFTTLLRYDAATDAPEESLLDLSAWAGQEVVVRAILRKPYGVTESRIGLYVHRIGVTADTSVTELPTDADILSVGAFNIQVFGLTKMDKPDVPEVLVDILHRYDLVLIQEIRDKSGAAIVELLDQVNATTEDPFEMAISDRLGRTWSKEQYAYFYRPSKLTLLDSYHYDDGPEPDEDLFQREPYVAQFETTTGHTFAAVALHSAPDDAEEELGYLSDVVEDVEVRMEEPDILLLGDFNAGCSYVRPDELAGLSLYADPLVDWWIGEEVDTTTTSTVCPYDRILSTGEVSDLTVEGSGGVYLFDLALQLSPTLTRAVSDHYPVEVLLDLSATAE